MRSRVAFSIIVRALEFPLVVAQFYEDVWRRRRPPLDVSGVHARGPEHCHVGREETGTAERALSVGLFFHQGSNSLFAFRACVQVDSFGGAPLSIRRTGPVRKDGVVGRALQTAVPNGLCNEPDGFLPAYVALRVIRADVFDGSRRAVHPYQIGIGGWRIHCSTEIARCIFNNRPEGLSSTEEEVGCRLSGRVAHALEQSHSPCSLHQTIELSRPGLSRCA